MLDWSLHALAFLTALGAGLAAGLFFAFSAFVMAALARLSPAQAIAAMQSINAAVINPLFMLVFLGTAGAALLLAAASALWFGEPGSIWLIAGSLLYLAGIIGVTMLFNVPLNTMLAAVKPDSRDGAAAWTRYLAEWVPWNHVRTLAGLASLACLILGFRAMQP